MKHNAYCAFCKTPRRIYSKKNVGLFEIASSLVASLSVMYFIWQDFDPKFILFFVVFVAVAEAFTQIRWRLSIVCQQCGFDPVLYLKQPAAAAEKVKLHLDRRKEDPRFLLAPPLNLPTLSRERVDQIENKQKKQGKLLSRQA